MWNQQLSLSSSRACLLHSPCKVLPSQFPDGQSPTQPKEETGSSGFMRHLMTAQRGITSLECTIISKVPVKWVYLEFRSFSWRRNWNLYCVLRFFFFFFLFSGNQFTRRQRDNEVWMDHIAGKLSSLRHDWMPQKKAYHVILTSQLTSAWEWNYV